MVYRNSDAAFNKLVSRSCGCRKIGLQLALTESRDGLLLEIVDEDGIVSQTSMIIEKMAAKNKGTVTALASKQLRKSGGTVFSVDDICVDLSTEYYIPAALFNELRRRGFQRHQQARLQHYKVEQFGYTVNDFPWPKGEVTYLDNTANKKALAFYRRHGVSKVNRMLRAAEVENCALMTTKYCIRAQLQCCPKMGGDDRKLVEPLHLSTRPASICLHSTARDVK